MKKTANDLDIARVLTRLHADRRFRMLLRQVIKEEANSPSGCAYEDKRAAGLITYQEAAELIDVKAYYIRKGIHRGNYTGEAGWVDRQSVIDFVMAYSPHAKRRALAAKLYELQPASRPQASNI